MTSLEKLISRELSLLELSEFLQNVQETCKINGVSRQYFYDIKKVWWERSPFMLMLVGNERPISLLWGGGGDCNCFKKAFRTLYTGNQYGPPKHLNFHRQYCKLPCNLQCYTAIDLENGI